MVVFTNHGLLLMCVIKGSFDNSQASTKKNICSIHIKLAIQISVAHTKYYNRLVVINMLTWF